MSQVAGGGDRKASSKAVNVELNIIPFIDLMSCVTAFLMVSSIWVNIARLEIEPAGIDREHPDCLGRDCDEPELSVLIEADEIWVGVSRVDDFERIPRTAAGQDWARLEAVLAHHKASALFAHKTAIEVAAASSREHPIPYQALIAVMDVAIKVGFADVGITEPEGLSARPSL